MRQPNNLGDRWWAEVEGAQLKVLQPGRQGHQLVQALCLQLWPFILQAPILKFQAREPGAG